MRKRRTREHVIADISLNHLEHFVLRAGHVVHRVFLVVYDAPAKVAYWAHIQDQFWNRITEVAGDTVTLRLNIEKQIDTLAIHQMRRTIRTWVRRSEVDHGSN